MASMTLRIDFLSCIFNFLIHLHDIKTKSSDYHEVDTENNPDQPNSQARNAAASMTMTKMSITPPIVFLSSTFNLNSS